MDIVERLGSYRITKQFDGAGRMVTFNGTPTPLELEARAEILRLRSDNERMREALKQMIEIVEMLAPQDAPGLTARARSALSQGEG